ncbi:hypothetical protein DYB37_013539 [Aphanomyces astaci]|uniref:Mitochondrial carrier protein n=1 Tax=Aphanomyces astaci TaxID=112090 RepID=A0A418EFK2_APHAT|nr:hypothetical protein DYB37_013539 [Aphanomyces astaci]
MQKDSLYLRFAAGAVASASAEMATLPVDITKVRLQAQGMASTSGGTTSASVVKYTGMLDAVRRIAIDEGPLALWKGAQPAVARQFVYSSMCMVLYEPFRDAITLFRGNNNDGASGMSFAQKLMAGGLAGAFSVSIANPKTSLISRGIVEEGGIGATFGASLFAGLAGAAASNPVDVLKTRLMTQPAGAAALYTGMFSCARRTFQEEGVKAFYKGFIPNWMRKAPWCVVFFVTYEQCRAMMAAQDATAVTFVLNSNQKKV